MQKNNFTIAIVGLGTMGEGIPQSIAFAGFRVLIFDISNHNVIKSLKNISDRLKKLVKKNKISSPERDEIIELNEAFAYQALAVLRNLQISDEDERVNPNGGAIALGHPLGMSGARTVLSAMLELKYTKKRYALCTMCVGVGQGISILIERV